MQQWLTFDCHRDSTIYHLHRLPPFPIIPLKQVFPIATTISIPIAEAESVTSVNNYQVYVTWSRLQATPKSKTQSPLHDTRASIATELIERTHETVN